MAAFEFKDNTIKLDIAGHSFTVDPVNSSTKIQQMGKKVDTLILSMDYEEICRAISENIDDILGAGAVDTIFSGRDANVYDLLDVWTYISGENNAFLEKKNKEYGVTKNQIKQELNRAQRRAQNKA